MINKDRIQSLIEEHITGTEKFLVELSVSSKGEIKVLMDGDDGFNIADCISLNKHLEYNLDRDKEDFSIEVSSYGIGKPLVLPRQYTKNKGRLVEVRLKSGEMIEGRLLDADTFNVELERIIPKKRRVNNIKTENLKISYTDIDSTIIKVEF